MTIKMFKLTFETFVTLSVKKCGYHESCSEETNKKKTMNDLLQKHGCSNVFTVPEGLKELMSDIAREVLREQPKNVYDFVTNYLSVLLLTREHGVMAVRILEELCDCRPSVSEHLLTLGLDKETAGVLANVIKDEIDSFEANKSKEKVKETDILNKILTHVMLTEEMAIKVCQVARNAYKDYSYRKNLMEQSTKVRAEEPWEVAAERTLAMYKQTKPTLNELNRATERIQAAYKGYHVRRNLLKHLKQKRDKKGPKAALPGPPLDIAGAREIDLGPVIDIIVLEDDVNAMFGEHISVKLGLHYDPALMLTNMEDQTSILDHPDDPFLEVSQNNGDPSNYLTHPTNHSANSEVHTVHVESRKRDSRNTAHASIVRHSLNNHEAFERNSGDEEHVVDYRSVGAPARKISFSMVPPELIPNDYLDEDQEVQEVIQEAFDEIRVELCQEIPEDIPDEVADDYTPIGSVVSFVSADVEDRVERDLEED